MGKSVVIQIASSDLTFLKTNKYKMCFAKKVNDSFNVVWQSYSDFLGNNTFSWIPAFQLFGTNTFSGGVTVSVQTDLVNITLGEEATMDTSGNIGSASSGGPGTGITFINQYGPIHPGLNSVSTGPDGIQRSTPIYVAENQIALGQDLLTPKEFIQVWFAQNIETSTMISEAVTNSATIDLTTADAATRLYSNGAWSTPSSLVLYEDGLGAYLKIFIGGVAAAAAAAITLKIAARLTGAYQNFNVSYNTTAQSDFTLTYTENPKLTASDQRFLRILGDSTATVDALVGFALDACTAELKTPYKVFNVAVGPNTPKQQSR